MTIAVFILITGATTFYCVLPLLGARATWLELVDKNADRNALEAEKKSYLRAIKDIEFEYASNKITEQDFETLKNDYFGKAAKAIQALDQLPDNKHDVQKENPTPPVNMQDGAAEEDVVGKLKNEIHLLTAQLEELHGALDRREMDELEFLDLSDPVNCRIEEIKKKLSVMTNQ